MLAQDQHERVRRENVETFTRMWLTLGPGVVNVAQHNFNDVLEEAKSLAARRWDVLLNQEAQIQRDATSVAARPKKRPAGPGDWRLPESAIERMDKEYNEQTEGMRQELVTLKELAKNERRELESWRVDFRRK